MHSHARPPKPLAGRSLTDGGDERECGTMGPHQAASAVRKAEACETDGLLPRSLSSGQRHRGSHTVACDDDARATVGSSEHGKIAKGSGRPPFATIGRGLGSSYALRSASHQ